jgi:tetratricopeptide (TPR) repeat protein
MTDPSPVPQPVVFRPAVRRAPAPYVPAIGPRLRPLLWAIFAGFALLGATGVYLAGVSLFNWLRPEALATTPFTFWMFLAHGAIGLAGLVPYLLFGGVHWATARKRPNRAAVRLGLLVFLFGLLVCVTGVALFQFDGLPQLPTGTLGRSVAYWAHVALPLAAIAAYVGHRRAGPRIQWRYGWAWGGVTAVLLAAMAGLHSYDPRAARKESLEGVQYFYPSEARTADGKFIPAEAMMMDAYCQKCHADIYQDHLHSAHKFSSFNNPAYLFSVKETREVSQRRDGNVKASRWCAGCHDPVPFFSGKFDDPNFDFANHETGHAGVTCVVCHSITETHGPVGNAAYTIEEAKHYPFAYSTEPTLQWVNNQMIKAKPEFHKKTFLKPLHKSAEFCSTCHKVALPVALNHYKDFLRGQNHYDTFVLSGMGNGSRSFYFPEKAKNNCADCHMPLKASGDFGAKDFDGSGRRTVHDHLFPGANTGLPTLLKNEPKYADMAEGFDRAIRTHADFLKDKKLRIDLFGVKRFDPDRGPDDASLAVLRPDLPALEPGKTYLVEVVVRTLNIGHPFSQGTVDSNEIWVDFQAKAGGVVFARSGATANPDDTGSVDEWAHFVNVLMLDREGRRIDRRNPQDIFTPLYDHQIPPGAANVVHYRLEVPKGVTGPIELTARLRYRKFDHAYMEYVHKGTGKPIPKLPVVDVCADAVTLPVVGGPAVTKQESPVKPAWQRWNDYGIGCYLEGGIGNKKGNLRQAEAAFAKLLTLGEKDAVWHAHANRARVLIDLGQLDEAAKAVEDSGKADPPAPWWLRAWLGGLVAVENATTPEDLDRAAGQFAKIVDPANRPRDRNMDFTKDYVVLGRLGLTLFKRGLHEPDGSDAQRAVLLKAVDAYERALAVDPEDLMAHYGLQQCYARLGADAPEADALPAAGSITDLAATAADAKRPPAERTAAAGRLTAAAAELGQRRPDPKAPRLPPLTEARTTLRAAFAAEADPAVRSALAAALAAVHRELHAIFKPDENARSRAAATYRAGHPAANAAAEAIVFYPTNRPGAPGLDRR